MEAIMDVASMAANDSRPTHMARAGAMARATSTWLVTGAGARVGKSSLAAALIAHARLEHHRVTAVAADLGVRALRLHGERMVERLHAVRKAADVVVVDCAGEREAILLAPRADGVVLVTTPRARVLSEAVARLRVLANAGVTRVLVVVNHADDEESGRLAFALLRDTFSNRRLHLELAGVVVTYGRCGAPASGATSRLDSRQWNQLATRLSSHARAEEPPAPPQVVIATTWWRRVWHALCAA